jgi:hypothetical protein
MRLRNHGSGAMIWIALTTAGFIAATYWKRRNSQRRPAGVAEQVTGATRGEEFLDETLEETFPASDPPSWSSAYGNRA